MTNKVQLRRVKMLIEEFEEILRTVPKPNFNMKMWCELRTSNLVNSNLRAKIREAVKNPCGTAACLAGKAGLMPRFRRLGFKWDDIFDQNTEFYGTFSYDGAVGNYAVKRFFGTDVFHDVFINTDNIVTIKGGIYHLKLCVARIEKYHAQYGTP